MGDLDTLCDVQEKMMATLKNHKRTVDNQKGFFYYDENDFVSAFKKYVSELRNMIESTCQRWIENLEAGNGTPDDMMFQFELGQPLLKSEYQMTKCIPFAAKKALIIHQSDYSSTRMVHPTFGDLETTKQDAINATHLAHGFGIADRDIVYFNDLDLPTMNKRVNDIKRELMYFTNQGKPAFLLVYGAGHGLASQRQHMVLNDTSGNIFPIEKTCRDICLVTKKLCTVFAVYDMCKENIENYDKLTLSKEKTGKAKGRGTGEIAKK